MARFKDYDYNQTKFLPINFADQILPGTFEHTLSYLIDEQLDLSVFDARYKNDDGGRPAYDPAILLKVILAAYSRGITSSRKIEKLCRENIVFMALSAGSQPHFTTIASFIAQMSDVIEGLFLEVLLVCNEAGLIGQEMFAIDGCKLPSNASKEWSGTHDDLKKKHKKMDRAVRRMLKKHRDEDATGNTEPDRREQEAQQIETLRAASKKIKKHLAKTEEKTGSRGKPLKGNITDNESAKMKTSKGVIQGYNGVAAVDNAYQIIIGAEAFGQGPEHDLLEPIVEQVKQHLGDEYIKTSQLTADSGFHNKYNLGYCHDEHINAYIADGNFRKRDPRFKERDRHQPAERKKKHFLASDFNYDKATDTCSCPAGHQMWKKGERTLDGHRYANFAGYLKDCRICPLRKQCMQKEIKDNGRQVSIRLGRDESTEPSLIDKMKTKIDSDRGRHIYSQRLGCVEPVFGNINTTKGLNRFTLRGKTKVNSQWLMFCLVHNIEKIQRYAS
jgi:transposase